MLIGAVLLCLRFLGADSHRNFFMLQPTSILQLHTTMPPLYSYKQKHVSMRCEFIKLPKLRCIAVTDSNCQYHIWQNIPTSLTQQLIKEWGNFEFSYEYVNYVHEEHQNYFISGLFKKAVELAISHICMWYVGILYVYSLAKWPLRSLLSSMIFSILNIHWNLLWFKLVY